MFTDPLKNLKMLALKETDVVADLGAGTGFYAVALGRLVPRGKVYAVEIVKDYLSLVKKKALDAGLTNVECFWGDLEKPGGTQIADAVLDAVVLSNVLFQIEAKDQFISEVRRVLKVGGKVLLIDWEGGFAAGSFKESAGDSSVMLIKTAMPKGAMRERFEAAGFLWQRDIDAGSHHYGMILEKR